MRIDWASVIGRLRAYPAGTHRILPPCADRRLQEVQTKLGRMPTALVEMLRHFNCAELFIKTGPLVSIFGVSTIPPLSPHEWATDWYIDKFTPAWRASGLDSGGWPIAMMNYGGLILLDSNCTTKEWDTAQKAWSATELSFNAWVEALFREGEAYLAES